MASGQKLGIKQIAADACGARLWAELRTNWAIALLYRAPSIPVAWLAARIGASPMAVSLTGLAMAISMPGQAAFIPVELAVWTVAISGFLFHVLDCVDGTLARLTGRVTKRGGDVDFLVDMAQWGMLYLSVGILADRSFDTGFAWTALAAATAWGRLMARVIRDRVNNDAGDAPKPLEPAEYLPAFLAGISGLIPFFALAGPYLGIAVIALAVYSVLDMVEAALPLTRRS